MIKRIKNTIEKYNMLKEGDSIIVGVSGGPDSVCLLHSLWTIKDEYKIKLIGVHINHMLRGEAADEDEYYVKQLCEKYDIPYHFFRVNIKEMSQSLNLTEEEAGRKARYDAFFEVLRKTDSQRIAVAQNKNDQSETLLMRLIRGSGLEGLAGIPYKREGVIIRPLLDIAREDIESYCKEHQLSPRIDQTNYEELYTRNKIRLGLIPYIQQNFNTNIIENLWKTTYILREDHDFINAYLEQLSEKAFQLGNNWIRLHKKEFEKQHPAIQKRMLLKCAKELNGSKDVSTIHLDNLVRLIEEGKTSKGIDWPNGLRIELDYDDIIFYKEKKEEIDEWSYDLVLNEKNTFQVSDLCLTPRIIMKEEYEAMENSDWKAFDFDKMKGKIEIRNRRMGDYITPSGMKGTKKLKEYFIDKKIPRDIRYRIPLMCIGSEVIWIIGHRTNENYRVGEHTRRILLVEFKNQCCNLADL